jgi:hypothetical protein
MKKIRFFVLTKSKIYVKLYVITYKVAGVFAVFAFFLMRLEDKRLLYHKIFIADE